MIGDTLGPGDYIYAADHLKNRDRIHILVSGARVEKITPRQVAIHRDASMAPGFFVTRVPRNEIHLAEAEALDEARERAARRVETVRRDLAHAEAVLQAFDDARNLRDYQTKYYPPRATT